MKAFKIDKWLCLFIGLFIVLLQPATATAAKADKKTKIQFEQLNHWDENEFGILQFTGQFQLKLGKKDKYGRATAAHIQLQNSHKPDKTKEEKVKYSPIGWHNYKFYYDNGRDRAWLMNRGRLISYQFSGLTDEGRNLAPLTAWLTSGSFKGSDDSNPDSMLFYENRLAQWLSEHPDYWLDYKVTPIYTGDELLPRAIELQYVGLDSDGNLITIQLGGKENFDQDGMTHVLLDNTSPNAALDYRTGTAENIFQQSHNIVK